MLRRPLLSALGAGLLSATGFAPLEWWPVTLACLALLLWLVHAAPDLRAALMRGWVFGVGHFTVGNNWIQHAFDFQDKMPPMLGYLAVLLLALYLAVYPAMAMGLAWRFDRAVRQRGGWRDPDAGFVLAAAAAWIATEWLRASLFTGYPWNPMGVLWLPIPGVAMAAQWIGTYSLSGIALLAAGGVLLVAIRDYRLPAMLTALLALLAAFAAPPAPTPAAPGARRVLVVQPNIGQDQVLGDFNAYSERVLSRLVALTNRPSRTPRLAVWPEGMVNQYVEDGYPNAWYFRGDPRVVRARIAGVLGAQDQALISGTALFFDGDWKLRGAGNSVWRIGPDGVLGQRYDKAHLVPYGEYLPARALLQPLGLARLVMGEVDFLPGPGPRTIDVPGFGRAGVQICYEIIFSGSVVDRAARPDFLFNPSNDAWFGSWGPPQHLAQARLRAIEEGLPVLRATPTGVSAVIDAWGRLAATVPPGTEGVIDVALPSPRAPTLFARLGNGLALAVLLAFVAAAVAIRRVPR